MTARKYYTVIEAAEYLRIPVNTLRKHLPEIRRSKLGRRVIISQESLDVWVESKTSKPKSELDSNFKSEFDFDSLTKQRIAAMHSVNTQIKK